MSELTTVKEKTQAEIDLENAGFIKSAITGDYERVRGDGLKFVANVLSDAKLSGLCYVTLEPVDSSQNSFEAMVAQWGLEGVINGANANFRNAQRNKAKMQRLPENPDDQAIDRMRVANPIFWTSEDAEAWRPGQRDLTLGAYDKLIREKVIQIKDPKTSSEDKLSIRQDIRSLSAARQELMDRQIDSEVLE